MRFIFVVLFLILSACAKQGGLGPQGPKGDSGSNGRSIEIQSISINVDRALLPWSDNNKSTSELNGTLTLPISFTIEEITGSLSGGGWIDVRLGSTVVCYQRANNTKRFDLQYRKTDATGCDVNSGRGSVSSVVSVSSGDTVQVTPREPKLAGIVPQFNFYIQGLRP
jgi:hypothetical protein